MADDKANEGSENGAIGDTYLHASEHVEEGATNAIELEALRTSPIPVNPWDQRYLNQGEPTLWPVETSAIPTEINDRQEIHADDLANTNNEAVKESAPEIIDGTSFVSLVGDEESQIKYSEKEPDELGAVIVEEAMAECAIENAAEPDEEQDPPLEQSEEDYTEKDNKENDDAEKMNRENNMKEATKEAYLNEDSETQKTPSDENDGMEEDVIDLDHDKRQPWYKRNVFILLMFTLAAVIAFAAGMGTVGKTMKDSNAKEQQNFATVTNDTLPEMEVPVTAAPTTQAPIPPEETEQFEWYVRPMYAPLIAFNEENAENEIQFKYNYTGTISDTKYLNATLLQYDCYNETDGALILTSYVVGNSSTYAVDVDINTTTISDSVHYNDSAIYEAYITFCIRVEYYLIYDDGEPISMNFHEYKTNITVNLVSNFTLTDVNATETTV